MDSSFTNIESSGEPISHEDSNNRDQEISRLRRQLARSEAAREEAESLLERKSRRLSQVDFHLRQKEDILLKQVDQNTQYLINAQRLANVATFHIDENVRFIGSKNFAKIVGSKEDIHNIRRLRSMVHTRDRTDIDAIMMNALHGGLIDNGLEHDVRVIDDYGRLRWLRWSAEQKKNAVDGKVVCYGAVRDITIERRSERHEKTLLALSERSYKQLQKMSVQLSDRVKAMEKLGSALREAREVAVRANKSKSRFLAMMSHDIRTPMNAILATLELLGMSDLNDDQKRQLKLAQNSGSQLLFLLADIIEYARSDGWLVDLEMQPIALVSFLSNAADTWEQLAHQKDLEITSVIESNGFDYIETDPTRVRQLLDNLISNAIKYTDTGEINVKAEILLCGDLQNLKITVSDTGNGISESAQKLLFKDLERGEHQDDLEIEGSGLGLSICRRIINAMDGEIGVTSTVGKGSQFWFQIPVKQSYEKDIISSELNEISAIPAKKNGEMPHILIAEDVAANRMVITSMLEKLGCSHSIAMDGNQVLDLIQVESFDAILMDVSMPRLNGMEATKIIRAQEGDSHIPIFAVTAFAADEEREAILASGMDNIISKPLSLSSLHQALCSVFTDEDHNEFNLYSQNDKKNGGHSAPVPDFDAVEYIDIVKLRHQISAVPDDKKTILLTAIVDDLRSWFKKFQMAWLESNVEEISSSYHALVGICNGFGAHKLMASLEEVRKNDQLGSKNTLTDTIDIFDKTLMAFRDSSSMLNDED